MIIFWAFSSYIPTFHEDVIPPCIPWIFLGEIPTFFVAPRLGSASRPAAPGPGTSPRFLPSPGFGGRSSRTSAWPHGHGHGHGGDFPHFFHGSHEEFGGFDGRKNMKHMKLGSCLRWKSMKIIYKSSINGGVEMVKSDAILYGSLEPWRIAGKNIERNEAVEEWVALLLKSRDPHLAGGEKTDFATRLIMIDGPSHNDWACRRVSEFPVPLRISMRFSKKAQPIQLVSQLFLSFLWCSIFWGAREVPLKLGLVPPGHFFSDGL